MQVAKSSDSEKSTASSAMADGPFKCTHPGCRLSFPSQNALNGHQNAHRVDQKEVNEEPAPPEEPDLELKLTPPAFDLSNTKRGRMKRGRGRPRGSTRFKKPYDRTVVGNYPSGGTVSKPTPMGSRIRAGHGEGEGGNGNEKIDLELKLGFGSN